MRSLQGRLFLAILAAVLIAVGASLALGIVLTRNAVRSSLRVNVEQQADSLVVQSLHGHQSLLSPSGPLAAPTTGTGAAGAPSAGGAGTPGAGGAPAPGNGGTPPPRGAGRPGPGAAAPGPRPVEVLTLKGTAALLPASAIARLRRTGAANGTTELAGHEWVFAARRSGSEIVLVTRPDLVTNSDFNSYLSALLIASGVAALLAATLAGLFSRRLSGPLRRLESAAGELAAGRHPKPLALAGVREIDHVAASFNEMAEQLALSRDAERGVLLSVSHDLRTPLTSIRGYAEGIEDGTVESSQAAAVISREAVRLERLVGDLLALARLRQGVLEIVREPVDLRVVADEAQERLGPAAEAAGLTLHVQGVAGPAVADHGRTLQVVSNLLENAIRMTPRGGTVTVGVAPGEVSVADDGPGIPPEEIPRAFERFHLRTRAGGGSTAGAGLGLAIVRELTEAMDGSVTVENLPAGGALFTVRLPV